MKLNNLLKTADKSKKRVGRGIGSGKGGHTVGRGAKGQKARGSVSPTFEGTKSKKSLIKRLPLLRGKGKLLPKDKFVVINVGYLNIFSPNEEVTLKTLEKYGFMKKNQVGVKGIKILGNGNLTVPLVVKLPVSKGAKIKIEKVGGTVSTA